MRLKLTCNSCRRNLEIEGEASVSTIKCPNCSATISLPSNVLDIDTVLGGFKVIRHLGSGSMGCVYLAKQVSMDRDVAIKVLPPEMKEREEELQNFLKEVRLLAKLDHPNIVTAFEAGEADGNYYMAMTYVQGETLEDKISREGPLSEEAAFDVVGKVAEALQYAWEKHQILHRDVKPENIMIDDRHGEVRLLDMGISRALNDESDLSSEHNILVGTPHYMSPEQANSKHDIDFRSDMYSLGCSLYQLVTGKVPYDADNVMQVLSKHALDPIPSPRQHTPTLHSATVEFLRRAMAKRPENRFDSWDHMLKDIRKAVRAIKSGTESEKDAEKAKGKGSKRRKAFDEAAVAEKAKEALARKQKHELTEETPENKLIKQLAAVTMGLILIVGLFLAAMTIKSMFDSSSEDASVEVPETPEADPVAPPDKPGPTSGGDAADAAARAAEIKLVASLRNRFQRLVANEPPKPISFTPLLINYQKLLAEAEGTEVEADIIDHLDHLKKRQETEPAEVMAALKQEAATYLRNRNYRRAIRLYQRYDGHCKGETEDERRELVARLREQQATLNASQVKLQALIERSSYYLSLGAYDKVKELAEGAYDNGVMDKELINHVKEVASVDDIILKTFEGQVGQDVVIYFKKGKTNLSIDSIENGKVKAFKQVKFGNSTGRLPRDFELGELHSSERLKRISSTATDAAPLMKGLLAMEAKKFSTAKKLFSTSDSPLSETLQTYAMILGGSMETLAEPAFTDLLETMDIKRDSQARMIQQLSTKTYSAREKADIRSELETFAMRFKKSRVYRDNRTFMFRLMTLVGEVAKVDFEKAEEVFKGLRTLNKLKTIANSVKGVAGGTHISLANNPGLRQVRGLEKLNVCELSLTNTSFRDVRELEACKLRALDLSSSSVTSIKYLKNYSLMDLNISKTRITTLPDMKRFKLLSKLNISNTPITSVEPLADSTVEELDIRNCESIEDLRELKKMSTLRRLYVSPNLKNLWALRSADQIETIGWSPDAAKSAEAFWNDYTSEATRHLRERYESRLLEIIQVIARDVDPEREWKSPARLVRRCQFYPDGISFDFNGVGEVFDISPLRGIPVVAINLQNTRVSDLSPLSNSPLKRLWLEGSNVSSLDDVFNCPLEELHFNNTKINPTVLGKAWPNLRRTTFDGPDLKSLKFLKGKKLEYITIYSGGFSSVDPLPDMPLVSIHIAGAPLKTVATLAGIKSLQHLRLPRSKISSIRHFQDLELRSIDVSSTDVRDLSALADCPLQTVLFNNTHVSKIEFLKGKALKHLELEGTDVRDIELIRDMPLKVLHVGDCEIKDYSVIASLSNLEVLWVNDSSFDDLTILHGKPINELRLDGCRSLHSISDLRPLKGLENLTIPRRDVGSVEIVWQLPRLRRLNDRHDNWRTSVDRYFNR